MLCSFAEVNIRYERLADLSYHADDLDINLDPNSHYFGQGEPASNMYTDSGDIRTWIPLGELENLSFSRPPWLSQQPQWFQDLIKTIEKATSENISALGKKIYDKQGSLTKDQKAVAFETYFRAKTKILEQVERSLKSDAQNLSRSIWKTKSRSGLAKIGEYMYKA